MDIRLTEKTVEVFFHGSRVSSHPRSSIQLRDPIVNPEHMPVERRKYLAYTSDDFQLWGQSVGTKTVEVVQFFLTSGKEPEQGYKSCVSMMKLADRYGHERLEKACERVLIYSNSPTVRNVSVILKNGQDKVKTNCEKPIDSSNSYGITRGAGYFRKGGER